MPRPSFDFELIALLKQKVIVHNRAVPAARVKLGELKKVYFHGYKGPKPQDAALARIDTHLAALARAAPEHGAPPDDKPGNRAALQIPNSQVRQTDGDGAGHVSSGERSTKPAQGTLPARGNKPARTLAPRLAMKAILFPADFRDALKIAGIEPETGEEALVHAAVSAALPAHRLVSARYFPTMVQIREVGEALGEIEQACVAAIKPVLASIAVPLAPENALEVLAHELRGSLDPVVIALLDAASVLGGGGPDGRLPAETLLAVDRLRSWSRAAREQSEAGAQRERTSRADPAARSSARALGFVLIETYTALTGRDPGFSRKPPGPAGGEPTGPLIRYLMHLFERARHNLSLDPERAELAQRRNPSPETLAAWIILARKGGDLLCGDEL